MPFSRTTLSQSSLGSSSERWLLRFRHLRMRRFSMGKCYTEGTSTGLRPAYFLLVGIAAVFWLVLIAGLSAVQHRLGAPTRPIQGLPWFIIWFQFVILMALLPIKVCLISHGIFCCNLIFRPLPFASTNSAVSRMDIRKRSFFQLDLQFLLTRFAISLQALEWPGKYGCQDCISSDQCPLMASTLVQEWQRSNWQLLWAMCSRSTQLKESHCELP